MNKANAKSKDKLCSFQLHQINGQFCNIAYRKGCQDGAKMKTKEETKAIKDYLEKFPDKKTSKMMLY